MAKKKSRPYRYYLKWEFADKFSNILYWPESLTSGESEQQMKQEDENTPTNVKEDQKENEDSAPDECCAVGGGW